MTSFNLDMDSILNSSEGVLAPFENDPEARLESSVPECPDAAGNPIMIGIAKEIAIYQMAARSYHERANTAFKEAKDSERVIERIHVKMATIGRHDPTGAWKAKYELQIKQAQAGTGGLMDKCKPLYDARRAMVDRVQATVECLLEFAEAEEVQAARVFPRTEYDEGVAVVTGWGVAPEDFKKRD